MVYKEVRILQFNGKHWAIGMGEAPGDYPARPYGRGIIAVKILPDESIGAEEIAEMIVTAKQSKKNFNMKIVAPSQTNESKLCKKFENLVDMSVEIKADKHEMKTKKSRLDTFT